MGTSGNPAKKAVTKKASSAADFKKRRAGIPLPLPSGLQVTAKRVELQAFLRQGNIPNPLMELVEEALQKGQEADPQKLMAAAGVEGNEIDLQKVNDIYELVNQIVISSLVEPKVYEAPESDDDRDDDTLYIDEVDDEDKMFIYQWACGGTSDIEQFRSEAAAGLASLDQG